MASFPDPIPSYSILHADIENIGEPGDEARYTKLIIEYMYMYVYVAQVHHTCSHVAKFFLKGFNFRG